MWLNKPPLGVPLDWKKPINKDLVLHLTMNEGHGDKVYDLSGYGNHGTLKNFAFPSTVDSGWNPGRKGDALQFDGANDFIDCGNNESLNITDAITIEAWVKMNQLNDKGSITWKGDHIWDFFEDDAHNCFVVWFKTSDKESPTFLYCKTSDVGKFIHVCFTVDTVTGILQTYKNGVAGNSGSGFTGTIDSGHGNNLIIGGGYKYFNGIIDEVRIYSRALSAAEMRERCINPWGVYLDEDD